MLKNKGFFLLECIYEDFVLAPSYPPSDVTSQKNGVFNDITMKMSWLAECDYVNLFVFEIKSDYFPRDYRFVLLMKIQFVFYKVRSEFLTL
jgi:hypothetical protein